MKTHAKIESERASKGQGGQYIDVTLSGSLKTEIASLRFEPNGIGYRLSGWSHDGHRIDVSISENTEKGEKQKGERYNAPMRSDWVDDGSDITY